MPRIAIQPEWTAEYRVVRDDLEIDDVECDGVGVPWREVPEVIETLLYKAAEQEEAERNADAVDAAADMRLQERKDGER